MSAPRVLDRPPPGVPRERSLARVAPRLATVVEQVIVDMAAAGYAAVVWETLRTDARQRYLYGFGRDYDDGRGIVTYSRDADETWHGFGLAVDIVAAGPQPYAPAPGFWTTLGAAAERRGLRWGGNWDMDPATRDTFVDRPHVQWGPPMRRSPSPRDARLRDTGGLLAVWREVGAA